MFHVLYFPVHRKRINIRFAYSEASEEVLLVDLMLNRGFTSFYTVPSILNSLLNLLVIGQPL